MPFGHHSDALQLSAILRNRGKMGIGPIATKEGFVSPRSAETLKELRDSFVEAESEPSFAELAERFNMPLRTVYSRCASERWRELRADRLKAKQGDDATRALIGAAVEKTDRRLITSISDAMQLAVEQAAQMLAELGELDCKVTTKIQSWNNATFGLLNICNGCKAVGLVSLERNLEKLGKEENGRWNPQMLHQLNVTVQNITKEAEAQRATEPVKEKKPARVVDVE